MFDDTREIPNSGQGVASARPQFRLSENVAKILESTQMRHHASRWASNLRFLTFDDSEDDLADNCTAPITPQSPKNSLRGQCQPCAQRVPVPSGHICEHHAPMKSKIPDREAELHKYANPCVHVREHSCFDCQHIPLFPNERRVTRFRIRRVYPSDVERATLCTHFVAVSYCWSNEKNNGETIPYKVTEEDGRIRDTRASNTTIDRIVAFARENGFRMIWIDQECIEQDNPEEKERAIQAMDYVYLRAYASIALFNVELQQKHLECVLLAYESRMDRFRQHRGRKALHGCRKVSLAIMCEAVSMIINDRWNTRAWILQEAFSSSGNMMLLFPRAKDVDVRSWRLICHELSQSELAVRLDTIQACLRICTPMILPELRRALQITENEDSKHSAQTRRRITQARHTRQMRRNTRDEDAFGKAKEIRTTIKRLLFFHPIEPENTSKIFVNSSKPRRTCNAAVALTYLYLRDLERVVDKLAIIANICSYTVRLNTIEIEKTQNSLSACILTLALANGDFSLLIPQIYHAPKTAALEFPSREDGEFSWLHRLTQNLQHAESTDWNPYGPTTGGTNAAPIRFSERGISFPGTLWNLNRFIELQALQVKYGDSWQRLRKAQGASRPSPGTARLATTHLLFEIIKHLASMGEKRLANSVLNSTSHWRWNSRETFMHSDMVESVDQFPSGLQIENRKGMFALDSSPDGWFHQCWIIDRVMEKGGLWTGSAVKRETEEATHGSILDKTAVVDGGEGLNADKHDHDSKTEISKSTELDLPQKQSPKTDAKPIASNPGSSFWERGHIGTMLVGTALTMVAQEVIDFPKDDSKDREVNPATSDLSAQSLFLFALMASKLERGVDDISQRQAVFDVDGDPEGRVMVLTPFQMTLESVPRPAMRAMSASWIVDGVEDDGERHPVEKMNRFGVKSMTRGMWEFTSSFSGQYEIT